MMAFLPLLPLFLLYLSLLVSGQDSSTTFTSITTPTSSSTLALPTTPYTGQALLTGACDHPRYTPIQFAHGGQLIVPLIGCSDDHPECCPSLRISNSSATVTSAPTVSGTGDAAQVLPTGVMSLLSQQPLSICPQDFTDIDPVCCPTGYSLHPSPLAGGYRPCVSDLTTSMSIPASVLASISSVIEASFLTQTVTTTTTVSTSTTSTAPTVSVSVDVVQVFALPLPCADNSEGGLSLGAKIGIGVGVGVGGLLILGLAWFAYARRRKRRDQNEIKGRGTIGGRSEPMDPHAAQQYRAQQQGMTSVPAGGIGGAYYEQQQQNQAVDPKHISSMSGASGGTAAMASPSLASPGSSQFPGSVGPEYAQGYMHGVHSALAMQQGQRGPPGYESPRFASGVGSEPGSAGRRSEPGELAGRERLEMEGDSVAPQRAEMEPQHSTEGTAG